MALPTRTRLQRRPAARTAVRGLMLMEVLIATLLFVLGIVGMIGVSTLGITTQTEARNRTDASTITNELAQRIWLNVDRSTQVALQTSLATYRYRETESDYCTFTGNDTPANPVLTNWLANTIGGTSAHALPGTSNERVSVAVGTGVTDFNRVTITVCWNNPTDGAIFRRHVVETWVN